MLITAQDVYDRSVRTSTCVATLLRNCGYLVIFPDIRYSALIRQLARMYYVGDAEQLLEPYNMVLQRRQEHAILDPKARAFLVLNFLTNDAQLRITETGIKPGPEMQVFKRAL
jgi:hypothetical protein